MKKSTIVANEFKSSIKGIDKHELFFSQVMYSIMNFGSGGGVTGLPASAIASLLITKGNYDGHRYCPGEKNFNKKRRYFFKNMCAGMAVGMIPKMIENAQEIIAEKGAETLIDAIRLVIGNMEEISVVSGGLWNTNSLIAVATLQLCFHARQILKEMFPKHGPTLM
ncbi:MAG: hypothetical protein FWC00_00870 [Firmicutes bacterium]|nr:hypothetical protein [Bacillota bacterium]